MLTALKVNDSECVWPISKQNEFFFFFSPVGQLVPLNPNRKALKLTDTSQRTGSLTEQRGYATGRRRPTSGVTSLVARAGCRHMSPLPVYIVGVFSLQTVGRLRGGGPIKNQMVPLASLANKPTVAHHCECPLFWVRHAYSVNKLFSI